jgi:peptide/nickel transport system ATP-binding protein
MVRLRDLRVTFKAPGKTIRAVSGVDLEVAEGEVVALIGESGSGKSVTLRSIMRLHPSAHPHRGPAGSRWPRRAGHERARTRPARRCGRHDLPGALLALDPVYTVGAQIVETIRRHRRSRPPRPARRRWRCSRRCASQPGAAPRCLSARDVGRHAPARHDRPGPVLLAQGLLADEPTTALDATVQIQILLLLRELQRELGLSIIFVTHDIGAAVEVADRIAVMYAGRIVEQGPAARLLAQPRHPYTMSLLQSRSHGAMQKGQRLQTIPGAPPDLANLPPGCAFAERCAHARPDCLNQQPPS